MSYIQVTKNKKWRDVSGALNLGTSSSAGFTLRKNYAKYIFPLECKVDRGDVDPVPILASLETPSKKESKKSQQAPPSQQQSSKCNVVCYVCISLKQNYQCV